MRTLVLVSLLGLFLGGCATWDGLKKDTSKGWEKTKEVFE